MDLDKDARRGPEFAPYPLPERPAPPPGSAPLPADPGPGAADNRLRNALLAGGALLLVLVVVLASRSGGGGTSPTALSPSAPPRATQPAQPTPSPSQAPQQAVPGVPTEPGPPESLAPTAKGTLQGMVLDSSGKPVVGATVTVTRATPGDTSESPGCPLTASTKTDAKGAYSFSLCQLAEGLGYTATVRSGGRSLSADLFVNSGQTTTYTVVVPSTARNG